MSQLSDIPSAFPGKLLRGAPLVAVSPQNEIQFNVERSAPLANFSPHPTVRPSVRKEAREDGREGFLGGVEGWRMRRSGVYGDLSTAGRATAEGGETKSASITFWTSWMLF